MIRGLYTASAGMQVEQIRQDMIANNLANVNTTGFRRDIAILEARDKMALKRTADPIRVGPDLGTKRTGIGDLGTGVLVNRVVKRFEQGMLKKTEEPFDLALDGDGYFTLADEKGGKLYTRAGEFTLDVKGQVVDHDGRPVLGERGPIRVPSGGVFLVSPEGLISVNGRTVDRLAIAAIPRADEDLERVGDTAFKYRGQGEPGRSNANVNQGQLESANVNSVQEMVEMIAALRHYEANQKALQAHDETLDKAVNEIARG